LDWEKYTKLARGETARSVQGEKKLEWTRGKVNEALTRKHTM